MSEKDKGSEADLIADQAINGKGDQKLWEELGVFSEGSRITKELAVKLAVPIAEELIAENVHGENWMYPMTVRKRRVDNVVEILVDQLKVLQEVIAEIEMDIKLYEDDDE